MNLFSIARNKWQYTYIVTLVALVIVTLIEVCMNGYLLYKQNNNLSINNNFSSSKATQVSKSSLLSSIHLFGNVKNENVTSPLKWKLLGVLVSDDPKKNQAIIASNDTDEKVYSVGMTLSDGTKIIDIFPDHIDLFINGQSEQLKLDWEAESPVPIATLNQE